MAARKIKLTHPGRILRGEFMEPVGLSAYALAKALDVPLPRVNDIVREKRSISPEMAVLLWPISVHLMATGLTCRRTSIWKWLKTRSASRQLGSVLILMARTVRYSPRPEESLVTGKSIAGFPGLDSR